MNENRKQTPSAAADVIGQLSESEMMTLGSDDIAFVKPVVLNGTYAYAVYSASGEELATVPNRAIAFATVRDNDLEPVSVH
jgi:hypothetical protein